MSLQSEFIDKQNELKAKRIALKSLFDEREKGPEDKRPERDEAIKQASLELNDLVDAIEPIQDRYLAWKQNDDALKSMGDQRQIIDDSTADRVSANESPAESILSIGAKTVAELLGGQNRESRGIKSWNGYRGIVGELALKTLLQTSGLLPLEQRAPGIQLMPKEERTVADLMLSGTTTAQKVTYWEETTFTNAAAETDEAAAKPESALAFTLREDNVRKIATWIPVTDEMMDDTPGFESYLSQRMGFMVKSREELQILRGAGTTNTILGVYNRTGVQTVTGYGESTIDSILHAITNIQANAFVEPTAIVLHPNDWFNIRASKDTTGNYLLGPAYVDPDNTRPWGLNVRVTTNALENTALVGAFNQAQIFRRSGLTITVSTEHSDYFIYNKLAVLAEERLALAVYRPSAFCKVEAVVVGS